MNPQMTLKRVVFPEPLVPIKPVDLPFLNGQGHVRQGLKPSEGLMDSGYFKYTHSIPCTGLSRPLGSGGFPPPGDLFQLTKHRGPDPFPHGQHDDDQNDTEEKVMPMHKKIP